MHSVHVLQGLPGSGKTTFARCQFGPRATYCSADEFLVNERGEYSFSRDRVRDAHQMCLRKFVAALQTDGPNTIVVDSTSITVAEIAPYVALAQAYSASVSIWHISASAAECLAQQTHSVPAETIHQMWAELAQFSTPPWWPQRRTLSLVAPAEPISVYVGLAVAELDELAATRKAVCQRLDLLPRSEAHVTLAYLDKVDAAKCAVFAQALASAASDSLADLRVVGVGAAAELTENGAALLLRIPDALER